MNLKLERLSAPLDLKTTELLVELEREAFQESGLSIFEIPAFALFGRIYLFKVDGEVAGHSILARFFEKDSAFLFSFALRTQFRGRKLSKKFMEMLLDELRSVFDSVYLTVRPDNVPALKLYRDFGFQIVEKVRDFYGKNEDRLIMIKILSGEGGV
jgi:ribosomal protein S18 acetylase RimI-like enzyme